MISQCSGQIEQKDLVLTWVTQGGISVQPDHLEVTIWGHLSLSPMSILRAGVHCQRCHQQPADEGTGMVMVAVRRVSSTVVAMGSGRGGFVTADGALLRFSTLHTKLWVCTQNSPLNFPVSCPKAL